MPFEGSCHCGCVRFSVDADLPAKGISCNCSHCRRKGFLLAFFPRELFSLERGAESLTTYTFNRHSIRHQFCRVCGTQPFALGKQADGTETCAVNLLCVPSVELEKLEIQPVDGASL
jgi:hypothetical protein